MRLIGSSMIGNIGLPFFYEWAGNPTGVSFNSLNPPQGALIIDNTTGDWYRKTSVLGDNSGYQLQNNGAISSPDGHRWQVSVANGGEITATQLS